MILGSIDVMMLYLSYMVNILEGHYIIDTHGYIQQYKDIYHAYTHPEVSLEDSTLRLDQYKNTVIKHNFPSCERNGVDQGIHNVLVHNNILPYLTQHTMDKGLVIHVQSGEALLYLMRDYVLYNTRGEKYSIIHQYDRKPYIKYHYYVKVSVL